MSATFAVVGAVVAEFVSANRGIGYVIKSSSYYLDTDLTFAAIVIAALAGLAFFGAICLMERYALSWHFEARVTTRMPELPMLDQRADRAARLLDRHRAHTEPYNVTFFGLDLEMLPEVFCPAWGEGSQLLGKQMKRMKGQTVLDVGTGSGGLAIVAAKGGAQAVVATDVSEQAVNCASRNAERMGVGTIVDLRRGSMFDAIEPDERFDAIVFNIPFMDGRPASELEASMFDENHSLLRRFLADAPQYLSSEGRMYLAFSSMGDLKLLDQLLDQHDLRATIVEELEAGPSFFVYEITPTGRNGDGHQQDHH